MTDLPSIEAWSGHYRRARVYGAPTDWMTLGSLRKLVSLCEDMNDEALVTVAGFTKSSSNEGEYYLSRMFVREEERD